MTRLALLVPALLLPSLALAHGDSQAVGGLAAGFVHPLLGLDHLLAMLAIGMWAAQLRRPALFVVPLLFPATMVAGAMLGSGLGAIAGIEIGIAASVAVLGLLIALALRPRLGFAVAIVAAVALLHGHVHGVEAPASGSFAGYLAGMALATLGLHLVAIAAARALRDPVLRPAGAAIALAGLALLAAQLA